MKNGLKSIVALVAMMGLVGCGGNEGADFKAGFILVGDENEGYSEAHINGINAAAEKLGLSSSQIIMKKKVINPVLVIKKSKAEFIRSAKFTV